MADRGTAAYLLDAIQAYEEQTKNQYSVGDREIRNLGVQLEKNLSRVVNGNPTGESYGDKAARVAAVENTRKKETETPPPGSQEAADVPEGRPLKDQPKSFEEAANEASKRMMESIKGPSND